MKILPLFILVFFPILAMTTPTISYTLGMPRPSTHLFEVEMRIDGLDPNERALEVSLPNWRSGRYLILDLASGIVEFTVDDGASAMLQWEKTDKSTWRIETRGASIVRVRYKVFANEFNLRTRGLNDERAFVDGTAVFMYAEKYHRQPVSLTVVPFGNWHVTTGLDSIAPNTFTAPHYEYLADCPLEIGTQRDFSFSVEGKEHVLSISGNGNYDAGVLVRDITRIIEAQSTFWGGLPYERYVFMLALSPGSGGGTEHMNSCVLGAKPFIFRNPETYRGFLGLVSHEFFHTWNVKRLRPSAIDTYDWTKEAYTKELWIAEGATSYYNGILLVSAGLAPQSLLLEQLSSAVERDRGRPGNAKQSLSQCSFDAWVNYWKNTKQSFNFESDYYDRGAAVSFILDMTIRGITNNKHSLDQVMRTMFQRFPPGKGGYTNADFRRVSEEIAGAGLQQFFDDYVDGVKPLPWSEALATAGLALLDKSPEPKVWLGIGTNETGERTIINRVVAGSPAYDSGLNVDDEIIALDGYKVRAASFNSRIGELKDGDTIRITVFRDERLREFSVTLRKQEPAPQKISRIEKPTSLQKSVLTSWLGSLDEKKDKK